MEIRLLGPLEVWVGDRRIAIPRRRERCLLAILAIEQGRSVPADRLVDLLWDGRPSPAAAAALRTHVSRLRTFLPGTASITRLGGGYMLQTDPDRIDVHRFRQLVATAQNTASAAARSELLGTALRLWRGPAFADIAGDVSRRRLSDGLEEARLEALDQRIEADLQLGRHRELVSELTDLVADHPLQDRLAVRLMLALYRSGRQADALLVHDQRRRMLRTEYGLDPSADLTDMHDRVLRMDPSLQSTVGDELRERTFLPQDVADFTGRASELRQVLDTTGTAATVVIDGMAGVGKTAFALHLAHRLVADYPDGHLYVDLHAYTADQEPLDAAAALGVLLRANGVPVEVIPETLDERAALWRARLAGRRILIVLDNAGAADQVRPLLPGTPGCRVLVTSRRKLSTLAGAATVSLEVLTGDEAATLFGRIVSPARTALDPEAVAEVVRLCGRLPLALRIAGARLAQRPAWSVRHLADRLSGEQERLTELAVDDQRVAAAFALSYRQLEPAQRRLFRLISLSPGPDLDPYAAAALADVPVGEARKLLEELLDAQLLLQRVPERYQFHDLIRDYARDLVRAEVPEPDRQATIRRLLGYHLQTTVLACQVLMPSRGIDCQENKDALAGHPTYGGPIEVTRWCEVERPNHVAAVQYAAANGFDHEAWSLTRNMTMSLLSGGHMDDSIIVQTLAIEAGRRIGDHHAELVAHLNLASAYWLSDRYRLAQTHATSALTLARASGSAFGEAAALGRLAVLHYCLGDNRAARDCATKGQQAAIVSGDEREQIFSLWVLSTIQAHEGLPAEAQETATDLLAVAQRIGEQMWVSAGLVRIALAHLGSGHGEQAIDQLTTAVAVARQIADPMHETEALVELADALRLSGDLSEALQVATTAFQGARRGSRRSLLCAANNVLCSVHLDLGDTSAAEVYAHDALTLARSTGHAPTLIRAEANSSALKGLRNPI